jgi:ABC-type bacteriocin/lantibiotic exporter with double-glycine peptidase domain
LTIMLTRTPLLEAAGVFAVPQVAQKDDCDCGRAVVNSVLRSSGRGARPLPKRKNGAYLRDIADAFRNAGLTVKLKENATLAELDGAGGPVVVLLQAWGKSRDYKSIQNGHYVVFLGRRASNVYFMDPMIARSYAVLPTYEFLQRWHGARDGGGQAVHQAVFVSGPRAVKTSPGAAKPVR